MAKKKKSKEIDIFKSKLVPECKILSKEEIKEVLEKYNISKHQLPYILTKDPMVKAVGAKKGDILEIKRERKTTGKSKYYRLVMGGIK